MSSPYKRRRPSVVKNVWVYRRLIAVAMVLGLLLRFIWVNSAPVTVSFPFGLGSLTSTTGLVILLSALVGSLSTEMTMTLFLALRRRRGGGDGRVEEKDLRSAIPEDRPRADFASKASEVFPYVDWS
jgi:uncharacterized integral membrane protein